MASGAGVGVGWSDGEDHDFESKALYEYWRRVYAHTYWIGAPLSPPEVSPRNLTIIVVDAADDVWSYAFLSFGPPTL